MSARASAMASDRSEAKRQSASIPVRPAPVIRVSGAMRAVRPSARTLEWADHRVEQPRERVGPAWRTDQRHEHELARPGSDVGFDPLGKRTIRVEDDEASRVD